MLGNVSLAVYIYIVLPSLLLLKNIFGCYLQGVKESASIFYVYAEWLASADLHATRNTPSYSEIHFIWFNMFTSIVGHLFIADLWRSSSEGVRKLDQSNILATFKTLG